MGTEWGLGLLEARRTLKLPLLTGEGKRAPGGPAWLTYLSGIPTATGPTVLRDGGGRPLDALSPLAWPRPGSFPTDLGDHRRASAKRAARHGVKPRWQGAPSCAPPPGALVLDSGWSKSPENSVPCRRALR